MPLPRRTAVLNRATKETKIQISLSIDGGDLLPYESSPYFEGTAIEAPSEHHHATQFTKTQSITIDTGIGFLDHMLHAMAKHGGWSLAVRARGDLISAYHLFKQMSSRAVLDVQSRL